MSTPATNYSPADQRGIVSSGACRYREDIDGLRALAIVPVVLFHAGLPGFTGGFVGVDVFFVISGFLITSMIQAEIKEGRFSLRNFYERRVRRIFPALFTLLGFCTLAAALLLYPKDYQRYARSLIAATLFLSSYLFNSESGYFDGGVEEKPLLHTWSLSVEELFYVIFPVVLAVAWRLRGERWVQVLMVAALMSFSASLWVMHFEVSSNSAFFLAQYRAWEFLIGSLLALSTASPCVTCRLANLLIIAGLLMILGPVVSYSENTSFPGASALLPCLGAALIIRFGPFATSVLRWLLINKVSVFMGHISYSLYLWHWPILVYFGYWAESKPSGNAIIGLLTVSMLMASLSWRFIERPFRGQDGILSQPTLFLVSGGIMVVLLGIGIHGELTGGWPNRYAEKLGPFLSASQDRDPRQEECTTPRLDPAGCLYGRADSPPTVVLWGDSHAAVFSEMLGKLAERKGQSLLSFAMWSCPPTPGWQLANQKWRGACARLQELAMDSILQSPSVRSVVLASWFARVAFIPELETITKAFYETVDRLLAAGKQVVIVYPVPEVVSRVSGLPVDMPGNTNFMKSVSQPTREFLTTTQIAFEWLDGIGDRKNLVRVYPHKILCDDLNCYASSKNHIYYSDTNHLSLSGAELFAPLFDAILFGEGTDLVIAPP